MHERLGCGMFVGEEGRWLGPVLIRAPELLLATDPEVGRVGLIDCIAPMRSFKTFNRILVIAEGERICNFIALLKLATV